ncbi:MAG: hypothetical protein IPK75_17895 [Acidobacteria bacterium]|nr:hypothetical protein [Acidobacteriota bacterium]
MQYPTVTLFDPGVGGAPTTLNPHVVPNLDTYDHSIVNEGGFESLEVSFKVSTRAAARAYLQRLMCHVEATSPRGRTVWEGAVQQVAIVSPRGQKTTRSLSEMANLIVVRYKATNGQQAAAPSVSDAASIARYGTKARLINFSTTTAAAAANRAAVVLRQIAHPPTTQTTESGSGSDDGGAWTVTLTCRGWWDTLGHLLTSTSSTAPVATHTQALTLLAAYNAINPFFGLSAANVVATGVTDTSLIEDDSTYLEAICTKLASGTSALERVVYGCYEQREITIRPWAQATPTTIHYVQRDGDPHIRDPYGSVVPIWDVRPDRMVSLPDLDAAAPSSTVPMQGVGRMYIRRVRVQITRSSQRITLEPEDANALEELLTRPAGAGVSGVSAHQAAIERTVHRQAQTRFSRTNGTIDLGGGSITTGGGSIDTGGGSISNPGGGDITYPPGSGATGVTGSGTTGALTKWSNGGAGVLTNAVAGTDYVAPGSLSESIDDRVAALLVAGSGIGLSYNDAGNVLTIANTGGTVGGTGTAGRIPQWATGGADLQDSTLIKTGAGLLTLSAAGAATLTIDASIRLTGSGASSGDALIFNGTAFAPTALTPAAIGAIDGSGRAAAWGLDTGGRPGER